MAGEGRQIGGWGVGSCLHFNKPSEDPRSPEVESWCFDQNTVSAFEDGIRIGVILESFRFRSCPIFVELRGIS